MVLSDGAIRHRLVSGENMTAEEAVMVLDRPLEHGEKSSILIAPFPTTAELEQRLDADTLDLRLSEHACCIDIPEGELCRYFYTPRPANFLSLRRLPRRPIKPAWGSYWLEPGDCMLGMTIEWVGIPPDLTATVHNISRNARVFLQAILAEPVKPGYLGRLTLEIVNLGKDQIELRVGDPICQIRLETLSERAERPYYRKASATWLNHSEPLPAFQNY